MDSVQRDFGAKMFAALANPARLHILEHLAGGPAAVGEIAAAVGLKQSMTSQHLACLLVAGVVVYEKCGNCRLYRIRGPRIARIIELVEEFYAAHLNEMRDVLALHDRYILGNEANTTVNDCNNLLNIAPEQ